MENPWSSKAKQLPEIRRACGQLDEGACDMCVFGLQCPESGEALRNKSWIATSSPSAIRRLCCACPGNHRHRRVAGSVKVPGQRVKIALSDFAGGYTSLFCETMVAGFEEDLSVRADEVFQETWMDDIDDIFNDDGERLEKAKRRKLTKAESEAK